MCGKDDPRTPVNRVCLSGIIEIRQEGFSPAVSRGSLLKDGRRGARIRRRAGWSIIADKIKWGLGLPWAAQKSRIILFSRCSGGVAIFSRQAHAFLPYLDSQSIWIFDTKGMCWTVGPFARCRCGSAFGSWPPRAGTGWSRRLTQGLASSGLPGSLSTADWLPETQDAVSDPLWVHRADINNPHWLGQMLVINSSIEKFTNLPW